MNKSTLPLLLLLPLFTLSPELFSNYRSPNKSLWGFYAHKLINRHAVFSLPPEMIIFYKPNINFLVDHAVDPDKRRYMVKGEAPKHYIDLDHYPADTLDQIAFYWKTAVEKFTIDTLLSRGIVPWQIVRTKYQLTKAFAEKDFRKILKLSADLGHYIGDANVPLHTTSNYNGQLTNQHGIHGFWESRIPELSANGYDFLVGKAIYLPNPQKTAWAAVKNAHKAVDSVLLFEKLLNESIPGDKKYSFEERNGKTIKVYSQAFSYAYEKKLNGMVERQLKASIKMVADFWYTAWIDAGQPLLIDLNNQSDLNLLENLLQEESLLWQKKDVLSRPHEN
ncbi:zinc dependent phospholipase C family protein [Fulvivirgaceae bacterium BMA12]|uniref:Zinc dependent phospholipase C family protein n=1 Tax=Agaribacillus aureus TaxID=3051825 RepID=A0ABT8L514_9BACT|nr:zinc dependent phospholipase C family protein [Fulvivirgaceae bacterium BMA12]